ncbi:MAG: helix-turn-helix transcriptional regulator [Spirochaetales bacterium]|nr:helix-turn-helix transcriptional regulator [Spirochaetales bacterium]
MELNLSEQLRERKKELNCLYHFAVLVEQSGSDIPAIMQGLTEILVEALFCPEKSSVQIDMLGRSYFSKDFKRSENYFRQKIETDGRSQGDIRAYIKGCYSSSPFIREEYDLINYLAERTGRVVQRIENERELEKKNLALSEILDHIQDKQKVRDENIKANLEMVVFPLIGKMKSHFPDNTYISFLERAIDDVFSSFGISLQQETRALSSREMEICNYIKNGLSSEEIADILAISVKTVNKHRFHIRQKLGIIGEQINLASYLRRL